MESAFGCYEVSEDGGCRGAREADLGQSVVLIPNSSLFPLFLDGVRSVWFDFPIRFRVKKRMSSALLLLGLLVLVTAVEEVGASSSLCCSIMEILILILDGHAGTSAHSE